MKEEDLSKCITHYFKEPYQYVRHLDKLCEYFDEYGKQNNQRKMIQKVFSIAQNLMNRKNLKIVIRRYIHVIDKILEKDYIQMHQLKYHQAISLEIVPQFIKMLKSIFQHGQMELFQDLKKYRKLWAKKITDQAYLALQTEALKQLKLDLDKGFQEETLKKIKKSYQGRKFSYNDFQKYFPVNNPQIPIENKKNAVMSSSEQEQDKPKKKVKKTSEDRFSSEKTTERQNFDMLNPPHSSTTSTSTFVNGSTMLPHRPIQNLYCPPLPNMLTFYSPQSYFPPPRVNDSAVVYYSTPPHPTQPQHYYQQANPYNLYSYPTNINQSYSSYQPYIDSRYQNQNQNKLIITQTFNKIIQKIQHMKNGWFFQCKFCGLFISTNQKYDQHMFEHFLKSQKQYEISHSRAEHTKKGSKSLMPSLQEWIQSNRMKTNQQNFVVIIEGGANHHETCVICRGELKVAWSDQVDSWIYEDAVRTHCNQLGKSICHSECYQTVNELERNIV